MSEDDLVVNNFGDLRVGSLDSTEQLFLRELCPEAYDLGFRVGDRLLQAEGGRSEGEEREGAQASVFARGR